MQGVRQPLPDVRAACKAAAVRCGYHSEPAFLIIGAAKCGTTALHRYLCTHPWIRPAWDKEVHFFDQDVAYRRGLAWYHTRFPFPHRLGRKCLSFEATPDYLFAPQCAERIFAYNAAMKLIVILRDPVARAYSFWNMLRNFHRRSGEPILEQAHRFDPPVAEAYRRLFARERFPDFDELVRRELDELDQTRSALHLNLIRYGIYAEQLQRYWRYFPRNRLLIVDHKSLRDETRTTLDEITDFLHIPRHAWDARVEEKVLVAPYAQGMSPATQALLREFYRPHNEKLCTLLGRDFAWCSSPLLDHSECRATMQREVTSFIPAASA